MKEVQMLRRGDIAFIEGYWRGISDVYPSKVRGMVVVYTRAWKDFLIPYATKVRVK